MSDLVLTLVNSCFTLKLEQIQGSIEQRMSLHAELSKTVEFKELVKPLLT